MKIQLGLWKADRWNVTLERSENKQCTRVGLGDCWDCFVFASVERHQWTWTRGQCGGGRRTTNIWAEAGEVAQAHYSITVLCSAQDALQRQHYAHKFAFHPAFTFAPRLMAFNCSCAVCLVMKEPALSPPAGPTTLPSSRSEHMFASSLYFCDTVLGERAVSVLATSRFPKQRIEKNWDETEVLHKCKMLLTCVQSRGHREFSSSPRPAALKQCIHTGWL